MNTIMRKRLRVQPVYGSEIFHITSLPAQMKTMHKKTFGQSDAGYVTLISVLIMGAVGLAITISLLLLGLSSSRTSFSLEQSNNAKSMADLCAEEGLERLRRTPSFTGTVTITLTQGACSYTVTDVGGGNRQIDADGTVDSYTRKVQIETSQVTPQIQIGSWQEVADF